MDVPEAEGNKIGRRKYRGVEQTRSGAWKASIADPIQRKTAHLGTFQNAEDAAMAYDEAAVKFQGRRARLNFPDRVSNAHAADPLSAGENNGSHSSTGNGTTVKYRGVHQKGSGRWGARICEPNQHKKVNLGIFDTAEEAAMAYDEAAFKFQGKRARLNFPDRDPHVPFAYSAQHLSPGENSPTKRKPDSQSAPDQNHLSALKPEQEHQIVRNPVSLEEQIESMQDTVCTSQLQDESCSGLDVGNSGQPDSSWTDLLAFEALPEHDTGASRSLALAAPEQLSQPTFGDKAPPGTGLSRGSATLPETVDVPDNCPLRNSIESPPGTEPERNVADSTPATVESPVWEKLLDSKQSGDAFDLTSTQKNYVHSSFWSGLSDLEGWLEHDSVWHQQRRSS